MAVVVRGKDLSGDAKFEPPYRIDFGICRDTVKDAELSVVRTFIPPGGRNQRHYHINSTAAGYVLKGHIRIFYGPDTDLNEVDCEEGDFFYVPKGEIHGQMNLSNTEPAELIAIQNVGSKEETGTIFVERAWD